MAKLIGKQPFHGLRFEGADCGSRLGFIAANLSYGLYDPDIGKDVEALLKQYMNNEAPCSKAQQA